MKKHPTEIIIIALLIISIILSVFNIYKILFVSNQVSDIYEALDIKNSLVEIKYE